MRAVVRQGLPRRGKRGRGRKILGAHILGPGAGELIHEYSLTMSANLPITSISRAIHVYPTLSQGVKRACDGYCRERLFTGLFPKPARRLIRRHRPFSP